MDKDVRLVFVPMFGDSFFTIESMHDKLIELGNVFVPMFGDSFFTLNIPRDNR